MALQVSAALPGAVIRSAQANQEYASRALWPHISSDGRKATQTAGRSGRPKSRHRWSSVNCTQRTPAGLPSGIPGIGEEMDGAMQQAAQPTRHFMAGPPEPPP
jgi:hypothetical protein